MTPKSGAKNSKKYFLKPIDKAATFCYNIKCSIRWCGSMAEQLICNQQVVGSTPITSSICYGGIPERPKGADCKSVVTDFAGPNPASPTKRKSTAFAVLFCLVGKLIGAANAVPHTAGTLYPTRNSAAAVSCVTRKASLPFPPGRYVCRLFSPRVAISSFSTAFAVLLFSLHA